MSQLNSGSPFNVRQLYLAREAYFNPFFTMVDVNPYTGALLDAQDLPSRLTNQERLVRHSVTSLNNIY